MHVAHVSSYFRPARDVECEIVMLEAASYDHQLRFVLDRTLPCRPFQVLRKSCDIKQWRTMHDRQQLLLL